MGGPNSDINKGVRDLERGAGDLIKQNELNKAGIKPEVITAVQDRVAELDANFIPEDAKIENERIQQVNNFLAAFGKRKRSAPGRAATLLGPQEGGLLLNQTGVDRG